MSQLRSHISQVTPIQHFMPQWLFVEVSEWVSFVLWKLIWSQRTFQVKFGPVQSLFMSNTEDDFPISLDENKELAGLLEKPEAPEEKALGTFSLIAITFFLVCGTLSPRIRFDY